VKPLKVAVKELLETCVPSSDVDRKLLHLLDPLSCVCSWRSRLFPQSVVLLRYLHIDLNATDSAVQIFCCQMNGITVLHYPTPVAADAWDRVISGIRDSVCVCVHALKRKQPELSTPNLVHIFSMAVAWHALTWRLKG